MAGLHGDIRVIRECNYNINKSGSKKQISE